MNIDTAYYPRKPIERLGIAPLTSMFFYGENDRRAANDWRPRDPRFGRAVDVDRRGRVDLASAGQSAAAAFELLFRRQPARLRTAAAGPQLRPLPGRRRVLRPAPEPVGRAQGGRGGWGKGAVQLVEIPTVDETFDNIVAFWNPADRPKPGQELLFGYRLYWGTKMPYSSPLGQTIATRTGIGGIVGVKRQYYSWHFAVDFAGGELGALPKDSAVEAVDHHLARHHRARHGALRRGIRAATARCSTCGRRRTRSSPSTCGCTCASRAARSPRPGSTSGRRPP